MYLHLDCVYLLTLPCQFVLEQFTKELRSTIPVSKEPPMVKMSQAIQLARKKPLALTGPVTT